MAERLPNIDWKKFEEILDKQVDDPFCFFQMEYLFDVDESEIRSRYFEICAHYAEDKDTLSKAHQMYQLMLNPLKRLDIIINQYGSDNKWDENCSIDDINENNEYIRWFDSELNEKELSRHREQIRQDIIILYRDINEALIHKHFDKLNVYRKKLGYLLNIKKMLWNVVV